MSTTVLHDNARKIHSEFPTQSICQRSLSKAKVEWPISETITCNARDVIWRTDYWGKNGKFLVFMDAEDSSESLVKAAMRKKVYKCLEVC